jgi:hypothetical protein
MRTTRLNNNDLTRIVRRVITENSVRLNEGAYGSFGNVFDKLNAVSKGNVDAEYIRPVAMWLHDNCEDRYDMDRIMRFISMAVNNAGETNSTEE